MSYWTAAHAIGLLSAPETGDGLGLPEQPCPPQQVLLGITIAEIDRQKMADRNLPLPRRLCGRYSSRQALVLDRGDVLFDFLASLRDSRALKTLAEQVFSVQSGMPAHASFDGGEFTTLLPARAGSGNRTALPIGFQRYGTNLKVISKVLPNRDIRLTICARQTRPNHAAGHRIGDVVLPALSTRETMVDAEMPSGKTLLLFIPLDCTHIVQETDLLVLVTAEM